MIDSYLSLESAGLFFDEMDGFEPNQQQIRDAESLRIRHLASREEVAIARAMAEVAIASVFRGPA